jgi:asparagine synthase (glutamine-hydrolysing)
VRSLGGYSPAERYIATFEAAPTDRLLDRCLHHDLRFYLPQLLHKEDRASMAVSLESRVPLLDYRIAEFLATVPPEQKIHGDQSKALLRAAAKDRLPDTILERRDKTPFAMPLKQWARKELETLIDGVLLSEACLDRGIFAADELRRGTLDTGSRLAAMNLELWFRLYIDRDPEWLGKVRSLTPKRAVEAYGAVAGRA